MKHDSSHSPLGPRYGSEQQAERDGSNAGSKDALGASVRSNDTGIARTLVHDLRNAIAPIHNAAHLLRFHSTKDKNLLPIIDIIDRQMAEMMTVLNVFSDAHQFKDNALSTSVAQDAVQSVETRRQGKRILIVDDNLALLTSLSGVLRESGHDVKTAANGEDALIVVTTWQPEFVLLDVHMPRMNGFELAKKLRALFAQGSATKLVMMSGSLLDETTMRGAERAGFDHCIDKIHDFAALEKLLYSHAP